MNTYKLTVPCTVVDINGNTVNKETTLVFANKEELISYLSGDTDEDEYGCGLINIRKYNNKLYEEVGRMCNHMSYLLGESIKHANTTIDAVKTNLEWQIIEKPIRKR